MSNERQVHPYDWMFLPIFIPGHHARTNIIRTRKIGSGRYLVQMLMRSFFSTLGVRARPTAGCLLAIGCGSSFAAAPVYFDIGGLFLYGFLYLLGLLIIPAVAAMVTKKKAVGFVVLFVYLGVPVAAFFILEARFQDNNERAFKEMKLGQMQNAKAFANYCKDRKRVVNARVAPGADHSLLIRFESGFTGAVPDFNASQVRTQMGSNKARPCGKTSLAYIEGVYDARYVPEKKGYEREVRLYKMCSDEDASVVPQARSRYELVLGESRDRQQVPWGAGGWMSRSSMRLVDKQTGVTLAEDAMYFLRYDSAGEDGCPQGMTQITSLITDVFPGNEGAAPEKQ